MGDNKQRKKEENTLYWTMIEQGKKDGAMAGGILSRGISKDPSKHGVS